MRPEFIQLENSIKSGKDFTVPNFLKSWLSVKRCLWIGGEWIETNKTFSTLNPATGEPLCELFLAGQKEVDRAVFSARNAYDKGEWSSLSLKDRCSTLKKMGDLILEHRAPLAVLESLDTGKPIRESFDGDIPRSALNFHFFSEFAQTENPTLFFEGLTQHYAVREPVGVVALITPWNLPLYLSTWKLAPALAMGNSIVLKPSELTPLTASYLGELLAVSSLPRGVVNILNGYGENSTGEFLTSHPGVDAISFTGETSTGRAIMKSASQGPTRVSFELGGKGASVVFADAPWEETMNECVRAAFRNQGEICLAGPRVFVAKEKYDAFLREFVEQAKAIRPNNPLNYSTQMGALISSEHWKKVEAYVNGVKAPGQVLVGGKRPIHLSSGNFFEPTVISGVDLEHPVSQEEIFGPVVSVYPFASEPEVIQAVNGTPYGLSCSIWTSDLVRAKRVASAIRTGLVWVNCWFVRDLRVPFGGQKRSGVGREGGHHSLNFFSEWKSVCVKEGKP